MSSTPCVYSPLSVPLLKEPSKVKPLGKVILPWKGKGRQICLHAQPSVSMFGLLEWVRWKCLTMCSTCPLKVPEYSLSLAHLRCET